MAFQTDVRDEVIQVVIDTLADATISNVYNSIKAAQLNLVEKIRTGDIDLPIFIVEAGEFSSDDEWSIDKPFFRCPVQVIAIYAESSTGSQSSVHTNLEAVRVAMDDTVHTNFESIEWGSLTSGITDDNLMELIDGQIKATCGTLTWSPGLLCVA